MAGIYLHIPFCKQKCSYCDFHFSTTYAGYRDRMILALRKEIELRKDYLDGKTIETIYFGGGTPSLLTKTELQAIIDEVYTHFKVESEIEFTLEANPDDINKESLTEWKELGINRLSIGVQSFFQEDLNWMNRAHTAEESTMAVTLAKEYGFSLTVDLIYGLPNRTLEDWRSNIEQLVEIGPEHISAYCLTVERRTALYKMLETEQLPKVEDEMQALQFELLVELLAQKGYEQYEISNFAKDQHYSKHNSNYWLGVPYVGIGPSAHSFDGASRQWNVANNAKYMKEVLGEGEYYEKEMLSPQDQFNELILTGLRTKWGVSLERLYEKHLATEAFKKQLKEFQDYQLIDLKDGIISLTEKGKLQADHIASMLFLV